MRIFGRTFGNSLDPVEKGKEKLKSGKFISNTEVCEQTPPEGVQGVIDDIDDNSEVGD